MTATTTSRAAVDNATAPFSRGQLAWVLVNLTVPCLLAVLIYVERCSLSDAAFAVVLVFGSSLFVNLLAKRSHPAVAVVFSLGMALKLLIVLFISISPPPAPEEALRTVPGVVYPDEAFYVGRATELMSGSSSSGSVPDRVALSQAVVAKLVDDDLLALRLVNSVVTGAVSVLVYLATTMLLGAPSRRAAIYLTIQPAFVAWSATVLKEPTIALAVALGLVGQAAFLARRAGLGVLLATNALALLGLFLIRPILVPLLLVGAVIALATRDQTLRTAVTAVVVVGAAASLVYVLIRTPEAVGAEFKDLGGATRQTLFEQGAQGRATITFPLYAEVSRLSGPPRAIGMAVLLLAAPPPTALGTVLSSQFEWRSFFVALYAASWWMLLPMLAAGAIRALRTRTAWLVYWCGTLGLWIVMVGSARFGAGADAVRYRDALLPVFILVALATTGRPSRWPAWIWPALLAFATAVPILSALLSGS